MNAVAAQRDLRSTGRLGARAVMLLFCLVLAAAVFLEALRQYLHARLAYAPALMPRPAGAAPGPVERWRLPEERPA